MAGKNGYTAEQIIEAIKGSGGIKAAIAANLGGAAYQTVQKYIEEYPTVKKAYEAEMEKNLDRAETVINGNIALAAKQVESGMMADSGDSKWLLSRKGKHRGYGDKQEVDVTSGGKPIKGYVAISPDDWDDDADADNGSVQTP